jgi:hypothetical protein
MDINPFMALCNGDQKRARQDTNQSLKPPEEGLNNRKMVSTGCKRKRTHQMLTTGTNPFTVQQKLETKIEANNTSRRSAK